MKATYKKLVHYERTVRNRLFSPSPSVSSQMAIQMVNDDGRDDDDDMKCAPQSFCGKSLTNKPPIASDAQLGDAVINLRCEFAIIIIIIIIII